MIVVDRDTKTPTIFRLVGPQYVALQPDPEGWVTADALSARLRTSRAVRPLLVVDDTLTTAGLIEI